MKINVQENPNRRKCAIFLLSLLVCNIANGQELKKVNKSICDDIEEQYYVLKNDRDVKNGPYRLSIKNSIYQLGFYTNNERTGIWSIYDNKHILDFKYDFDTKKILDLNKRYFMNSKDTTSRAPIYLGGDAFLLYRAMCYMKPGEELYQNISPGNYRVVVKFEIDTIGVPTNYAVLLSCGKKTLDDEAIRCVKLASNLDFPFLPALEKGKPFKTNMIIPINFSYREVKEN